MDGWLADGGANPEVGVGGQVMTCVVKNWRCFYERGFLVTTRKWALGPSNDLCCEKLAVFVRERNGGANPEVGLEAKY